MGFESTLWEVEPSVSVLELSGELVAESAEALRKILNAEMEAGRREMIVVCEKLTRVDTRGLSRLNQAAWRLSTQGGLVHLVAPSDALLALLDATGARASYRVHASEIDALQNVGCVEQEPVP